MKSNANISINDSMYISKTNLEKLKIDASSGNSQAASKLANYFKSIDIPGFRTLNENQRVEFEIVQGPKGMQADHVHPL